MNGGTADSAGHLMCSLLGAKVETHEEIKQQARRSLCVRRFDPPPITTTTTLTVKGHASKEKRSALSDLPLCYENLVVLTLNVRNSSSFPVEMEREVNNTSTEFVKVRERREEQDKRKK